MSCTLLQIQTHLLTRRRTLKPSPKFTTQISIWPLYHLPKFWPAFFCEIRQKFIVRIPMCGKNTFRWPRAYRDEAFKALGRTGRLATIITHYHPRPPFFLIGREKKSMRAPSPLSLPHLPKSRPCGMWDIRPGTSWMFAFIGSLVVSLLLPSTKSPSFPVSVTAGPGSLPPTSAHFPEVVPSLLSSPKSPSICWMLEWMLEPRVRARVHRGKRPK